MRGRRFVLILSLWLLGCRIVAQDTGISVLLEDDREEWTVAFAQLTSVRLDAANEYLTSSVPRLFLEDIRDIQTHTLNDSEADAYRQWLIENATVEIGKRLTAAREARDALLFTRLEPSVYQTRYAEETEKIQNINQQLLRLEDTSLDRITVTPEKPVRIDADELVPVEEIEEFAEERDADLVIYGLIEQVEEYVYLEVFAWDRFQRVRTSLGATASRSEEIYQASEDIQARAARRVLGRDWAHLRVVAPQGARVFMNGELKGTGAVEGRYLDPGDTILEVTAEGGRPYQRIVTLVPFETTSFEVTLDSIDVRHVTLSSEPDSADVYVQSVWRGRTPLSLRVPDDPIDVSLVRQGYRDDSFLLSPDAPAEVTRTLVPQDRNWKAYIQDRRRTFYWSLGAFALSVPGPVILGALFDDVAAQLDEYDGTAPVEDAQRLTDRGNAYLYSRYGAFTLTVGLLANTIWQLVRYIRAAEYRVDG